MESSKPEAVIMSVNIGQLAQSIGHMSIYSKKGTICDVGMQIGERCEFFHYDTGEMSGC